MRRPQLYATLRWQTLCSSAVPKALSILVCIFEVAAAVLTSYKCLKCINTGYTQGKSFTSFILTQGLFFVTVRSYFSALIFFIISSRYSVFLVGTFWFFIPARLIYTQWCISIYPRIFAPWFCRWLPISMSHEVLICCLYQGWSCTPLSRLDSILQ